MPPFLTVFLVSLGLGLTCFGGPFVHLARFRRTYVERRAWVDETTFVGLLALCQLLPGPTSSQLGIAIGRRRAGLPGALAAWLGFTLPSAVQMAAAAAFWSVLPGSTGAVRGLEAGPSSPISASAPSDAGRGWPWLAAFGLLFVVLPWAARVDPLVELADIFFRAGALVFGGGHVVLPVLEASLTGAAGLPVDLVTAGYGLAQLMPGPLFSVAAFWGWSCSGPGGALVALTALFLPGFLLVLGFGPLAERQGTRPWVARASAGLGAAVTGLLLSVLVRPLGTDLAGGRGLLFLAAGLLLLHGPGKVPAPVVVLLGAAAGVWLGVSP